MLQKDVTLGHVYECELVKFGPLNQLLPSIEVVGGTVNVYGSHKLDKPASLAEMSLDADNPDVSGIVPFQVVPKYLAFTGTATRVTINGMKVEDMGAIA